MPTNWNRFDGGISDQYRTGGTGQFSDCSNADTYSSPDGFKIDNKITQVHAVTGEIRCGLDMSEYGFNGGFLCATNTGKVYYKGVEIQSSSGKAYLGCFYDKFTSGTEKDGLFLIHFTGIDRMEYTAGTDSFGAFTANVYTGVFDWGISDQLAESAKMNNFPIIRNGIDVYIGVKNKIIAWDGVLFDLGCSFPKISTVVGMTAYGDNIHIYSSDKSNSYKHIWNPILDDTTPSSMVEFRRLPLLGVTSAENADICIANGDDIYQSSGLQRAIFKGYWQNTITPDRNYNGVITNRLDDVYIGTSDGNVFALIKPYFGSQYQLIKWSGTSEITFLYGTKDSIYVGSGENLGRISRRVGEDIADSCEIISNFETPSMYLSQIERIVIKGNVSGYEYDGQIIVFARKNINDQWTEIATLSEGRQGKVFEIMKTSFTESLGAFSEVQYKAKLVKNGTKSPLFHSLYAEYSESKSR